MPFISVAKRVRIPEFALVRPAHSIEILIKSEECVLGSSRDHAGMGGRSLKRVVEVESELVDMPRGA